MKYLALILVSLGLSGCIDTGGGVKIGHIVQASDEGGQGVMCRTFEAEIIRGGLSNGSGAAGQSFHFTVEGNPELFKKVQHYRDTQQEVKITYRTEMATACRSESPVNAFLVAIEPLGAEAARPLAIDTAKPLQVQQVSETVESRDAKMLRLLQVQQQLIQELAGGSK